jgi:ubiquinone/menaquinone biosynthesis C-methylase UbiE
MTDYDRTDIPAGYDRDRDHGPEVLDLWMRNIAAHLPGTPARILDLGCGTGRFADALSVRFNAEVVDIDPSFQRLSRALAKRHDGRVGYVRARGEALPLPSASIDLIVMSMWFHHLSDHSLVASECRRVSTCSHFSK